MRFDLWMSLRRSLEPLERADAFLECCARYTMQKSSLMEHEAVYCGAYRAIIGQPPEWKAALRLRKEKRNPDIGCPSDAGNIILTRKAKGHSRSHSRVPDDQSIARAINFLFVTTKAEPNRSTLCLLGCGDNANAVREFDVIILGVDPAEIEKVLTQHSRCDALQVKLVISIAAGSTRPKLEADHLRKRNNRGHQLGPSLGLGAYPAPALPPNHLAIYEKIVHAVQIEPRLMNATTAVDGFTPAFFAVICDALIDAAMAVGVPRDLAHTMILQSMQGTASMLQGECSRRYSDPAVLRDQGTSFERYTMGGLMVMKEAGVRGHIGRALREAVTLARLMETTEHVNDTRH
ncbi:uncharacterized protein N7477_006031 [Penicillium maclennaniae]|uniref:uncharacterized protein n=1 Tax=Penicillium maclennaniae TaxID=1343394 RepID=UPI00253FAF50|nr:uncharacterized protein N7477_006031 [Penicillium maclennaniae]KAJ5670668.1 hypothetical protein N7477_006031 [Penicillium maclennaniae]